MGPFIHKFETGANKYIYDVNSNRVFRVSAATFDVIDDFQEDDQLEDLLRKHGRHTKRQLKECGREIVRARKGQGIFLPDRPKRMTFGDSLSIEDLLASSPHEQLILNVTDRCNLRCEYCVYSGRYPARRKHGTKSMRLETAKKAIDNFLKNCSDEIHISFYGGEPLLKLDLIRQIVTYAESVTSRRISWNTTTNGILLAPELCDYFREKRFSLMISLDGPRDVHDRYRVDGYGRGSFDAIRGRLQYLQAVDEEYFNKHISFSVVSAPPFNLRTVADFFGADPLVRQNAVSFSYMDQNFESFDYAATDHDFEILEEEERRLADRYFAQVESGPERDSLLKGKYERDLIGIYHRPKTPLGEEIRPNGCCIPGSRRLFVTADGILHVCERMDYAYPIGTVEKWIDPQLVGGLIEDYFDLSGDCFDCWACRLCTRCFASFSTAHGKFDRGSRHNQCNSSRDCLHNLFVHYYEVLERNPSALDFLAEASLD